MTNAIEQAKREMYYAISCVKAMIDDGVSPKHSIKGFEDRLESYLELLRQDHEALHETARKRFEDLQVAEAKVEEFSLALASANLNVIKVARESRDSIRKLEAVNRSLVRELACVVDERDSMRKSVEDSFFDSRMLMIEGATPVRKFGDRVSCEAVGGHKTEILGALEDIRKIADAWALTGRRAKKSMLKISGILARPEVYAAMESIAAPTTCMHSFHPMPMSRNDKSEVCIYCWEKKECMHSFFAIGQDQMKCTFCGVGK